MTVVRGPSKRARTVAGCLIALGAAGPIVLVVMPLAIWQILAPAPRPGIDALKAKGCERPSLTDFTAWRDGGAFGAGHPRYALHCYVPPGRPAPTCDEVAATYVRAAGPLDADVRVSVLGGSLDCDQLYAGDGTPR